MTTTLAIADTFGKRHDNVLKKLESLDCSDEFALFHFKVGSYSDGNGQERPMYKITRDGWATQCLIL